MQKTTKNVFIVIKTLFEKTQTTQIPHVSALKKDSIWMIENANNSNVIIHSFLLLMKFSKKIIVHAPITHIFLVILADAMITLPYSLINVFLAISPIVNNVSKKILV